MTNKEISINLVKEMVNNGWKLGPNQTIESVAAYYKYNVEFFKQILESIKKRK